MGIIVLVVIYIAFFIFLITLTKHENTRNTKSGNTEADDTINANAIKAVISLLEKLEEFRKRLGGISATYVSIIPVDSDGVYYGIGSNKVANQLEIHLELFEKFDAYMLSIIKFAEDQTDSDALFEWVKDEQINEMVYAARFRPMFSARFKEHYKKFMPILYKAVVERFPDLNIELNSGNIHYYNPSS